MTKDELIVKQQLEIEGAKMKIARIEDIANNALHELVIAEQRSVNCPEFPKVAMRSICSVRAQLRGILEGSSSIGGVDVFFKSLAKSLEE